MSGPPSGRGVLDGAFTVLGALETSGTPMRCAEITRATGIPKQTVSRLLTQLEDHGAVTRVGERFTLGSGLFRLGSRWSGARLAAVGQPVLAELHRRTAATVHLAVLVDDAVCYVAKLVGRDGDVAPSEVGLLQPPAGSAVGKVLLAGLPQERRKRALEAVTDRGIAKRTRAALDGFTRSGVAFDHEEVSDGLCCAAAPVLARHGAITGALSVSVPASRPLPPLTDQVRAAAKALSRLSGTVSP
ncbi:IclR family transcriptional regulator [Saccharothrix coeruleofusca]|uniref:IclR family transcriptional regulator n=1 Tax=Saccharothrix coeruleofusca TaxID=33919 RepID=A0A918EEK9_9PSEU|nr:IclR family transcriptional regulator [Saccharothrix coeruleofusca]GGP53518.1 IclR family transcriptional regulator [Saccharothrix coeruleofusca]